MTAQTKKWRLGRSEADDGWEVLDATTDNADVIAIVPDVGDEEYDDEVTRPNAQLIAAAPNMLKHGTECVEWMESRGFVPPCLTNLMLAIDAAVNVRAVR